MITAVACVDSVAPQATHKAYQLSDGTGRIAVQCYSDADAPGAQAEIGAGDYVRVFGHLRGWQGQEGINAHHMAPVESANEIS